MKPPRPRPRPINLQNPRFIHRMTDLMRMRRSFDRNAVVSVLAVPACCVFLAIAAFIIITKLT